MAMAEFKLATVAEIEADSKLLSATEVAGCYLCNVCENIVHRCNSEKAPLDAALVFEICEIATHFKNWEHLGNASVSFESMLLDALTDSKCINDAEFAKLCAKPDLIMGLVQTHVTFGDMLTSWAKWLSADQLAIAFAAEHIKPDAIFNQFKESLKEAVLQDAAKDSRKDDSIYDRYEVLVTERGGPTFDGDEHSLNDLFKALIATCRPTVNDIVWMQRYIEKIENKMPSVNTKQRHIQDNLRT